MAVSKADLQIYQGDDFTGVVTVSNGSTPPEEILVGYIAQAQIRDDVADESTEVVLEIQTAIESPFITLFIPRAQTVDLCGEYVWDLQITSPSDVVTTILKGDVRVTQEVTR